MVNSRGRRHGRACVAACLLLAGLVIAAPGDLDPDFGDGGLLSLRFSEFGHSAQAVAEQADGKLLIVGFGAVELANSDDFIVARLDTDGTLDAGFGDSGAVIADYTGFFDVAYAVAQQSDGKIVLAGAVGVSGTASDLGLARLNTDGTLDATFGNGGWAAIDLGGDDEAALGLILQPGGGLVAAGYTDRGGSYQAVFVRVTGAGALDPTFGTAGATVLDFGAGSQSFAHDLAQQSSGKIVSVGAVVSFTGERGVALARLSADGIPDPSFDSDGLLTLPIEGAFEYAFSLAIQSDDSIVTAGYEFAKGAGHFKPVVRRFGPEGTPDAGFGSGGKSIVDVGSESSFNALVAQEDGSVVATGYRLTAEFFPDLILARLDAAGQLDTGFGIDGVAVADFGAEEVPPYGVGYGLIRQADDKYVAVGYNFNTGSMIVARFDDDASAPGRIGLTHTYRSAGETEASISYTVRRTGGRSGAVSVSYATAAGEAQPGSDFVDISGTLSWNDGEADDKTLTIDLIDDGDAESTESFTLNLTDAAGGARLAASAATAQISSEDGGGQLGFSFAGDFLPATEGATGVTLPVFRLNGSEGAVGVSYVVTDATATEAEDFVISGTLSWANGDTAEKFITIDCLEDTLAEGQESLGITLRNPTGGATLHPFAQFQVFVIEDNDRGFTFGNVSVSVRERDEIAEVRVVRSDPQSAAASVDYSTSGDTATAGSDFTAASGTLTWASGDSEIKTIRIPISDDSGDEPDETFTVSLANPTGGLALGANPTTTVTIVDDDRPAGGASGGGGGGALAWLELLGLAIVGWLARIPTNRATTPRSVVKP